MLKYIQYGDFKEVMISDFDLESLVDGELDSKKRESLLKHVELNPVTRRKYEKLLHQKKLLQAWWDWAGKEKDH